jgi:hypothetical protein
MRLPAGNNFNTTSTTHEEECKHFGATSSLMTHMPIVSVLANKLTTDITKDIVPFHSK